MNVEIINNNSNCTIKVSGRLDTVTTPVLEDKINNIISDYESLILDFSELDYISSAGLRCILATQKKCNGSGKKLLITGCNSLIMETFEMTGFSEILSFG